MKYALIFLTFIVAGSSFAQSPDSTLNAASYKGASAALPVYKAVYSIETNDTSVQSGTLQHSKNALEDKRLKGKLQIELVAYSYGSTIFLRGSTFHDRLLALKKSGVILAQCNNFLVRAKVSPTKLYPFVSVVPSGVGELILLQQQGWAIITP